MSGDFLLSLQKAKNSSVKGMICGVLRLRDSMPKEDYEGLLEAIDDKTIAIATISEICRKHNYDLGEHTVRNHRKKNCRCFLEPR